MINFRVSILSSAKISEHLIISAQNNLSLTTLHPPTTTLDFLQNLENFDTFSEPGGATAADKDKDDDDGFREVLPSVEGISRERPPLLQRG